jgi:hypothetical protein
MTGVLQGSLTRPSDEEGVTKAGSTVGSQARRQDVEPAAAQQLQQKGDTAWSLLGKLYSSQVLAYMVAITDAQALVQRMRSMRPGELQWSTYRYRQCVRAKCQPCQQSCSGCCVWIWLTHGERQLVLPDCGTQGLSWAIMHCS